jgi:hypothetical protein
MSLKTIKTLFLALLLASMAYQVAASGDPDPVKRGYKITACLMKLVNDVVPLITLSFILIAGITQITSAESKKQRIQARRFVLMGVGGFIFVKVIVAIAAMPPFNVTLSMCVPLY